jgi:hypothetical protein
MKRKIVLENANELISASTQHARQAGSDYPTLATDHVIELRPQERSVILKGDEHIELAVINVCGFIEAMGKRLGLNVKTVTGNPLDGYADEGGTDD